MSRKKPSYRPNAAFVAEILKNVTAVGSPILGASIDHERGFLQFSINLHELFALVLNPPPPMSRAVVARILKDYAAPTEVARILKGRTVPEFPER